MNAFFFFRTSWDSWPNTSQSPFVMVLEDESQPSVSEFSKTALVSVPSNPQGLLYVPVITSLNEPSSSCHADIPPFVKVLNAKGEVTQIALAENGRYRTYQVTACPVDSVAPGFSILHIDHIFLFV